MFSLIFPLSFLLVYFWAEARGTGGGRGREHMQIKDKTRTVSGVKYDKG